VRHVYECQLRRADLHGDGTVGNVLYVDYLQEARLDLLRHYDTSPSPNPGEGLVVVRTVVEYVRPLRLEDAPLSVGTWVTDIRPATITLGYELTTKSDAGPVVHARATTVLALYVFAEERPRRFTAGERDRLATSLGEPLFEVAPPARSVPWAQGGSRRPIQVRFSDVDMLGHVNNVRYFDYVQEGQVEVLTGVFQEARVEGQVDTVVARMEMDHLGQLNLRPEPYDVWSRVAGIGRTSLKMESELRDGDRVMARARVVEVNVDADGKPAPWRDEHRVLFAQRMG
jgi:acyl-CoA thioester hydrolase